MNTSIAPENRDGQTNPVSHNHLRDCMISTRNTERRQTGGNHLHCDRGKRCGPGTCNPIKTGQGGQEGEALRVAAGHARVGLGVHPRLRARGVDHSFQHLVGGGVQHSPDHCPRCKQVESSEHRHPHRRAHHVLGALVHGTHPPRRVGGHWVSSWGVVRGVGLGVGHGGGHDAAWLVSRAMRRHLAGVRTHSLASAAGQHGAHRASGAGDWTNRASCQASTWPWRMQQARTSSSVHMSSE
mmetsp:Transcript_21473/g.40925  ORF Transcript_21473/g.40925 Transcript_21473/m.40925 type:complete len:240 (-) Transcript_21473:783-1502(-)